MVARMRDDERSRFSLSRSMIAIDGDLVEEIVNWVPQPRQFRHCCLEPTALQERSRALHPDFGQPFGEYPLLRLAQQHRIDVAIVSAVVSALLDADDVWRHGDTRSASWLRPPRPETNAAPRPARAAGRDHPRACRPVRIQRRSDREQIPFIAQIKAPETFGDKIEELAGRVQDIRPHCRMCAPKGGGKWQAQTVLDNQPDLPSAARRSANGSRAPGRLFADREEGDEESILSARAATTLIGAAGQDYSAPPVCSDLRSHLQPPDPRCHAARNSGP